MTGGTRQEHQQLTHDDNAGRRSDIPGQVGTAVLSGVAPLNRIDLQSELAVLAEPRRRGGERRAGVDLMTAELAGNEDPPLEVGVILLTDPAGEMYDGTRQDDRVLRRLGDLDGLNARDQLEQNS